MNQQQQKNKKSSKQQHTHGKQPQNKTHRATHSINKTQRRQTT